MVFKNVEATYEDGNLFQYKYFEISNSTKKFNTITVH